MASLSGAVAFAESFCAARSVRQRDALRLAFIVEELFTNTVTHGHGGDSGASVTVGLALNGGEVVLAYTDCAPAHNPLDHFQGDPGTLATTLSMRPVGGLGTYLIGHLIETGRYRREDGRNILELTLPLDG